MACNDSNSSDDDSNAPAPIVTGAVAAGSGTSGVDGFEALSAPTAVATFEVGGTPYAIIAAVSDDGFQVIDLSDPTNPTAVVSGTNGVDGFEVLTDATAVDTFEVGGTPYAIIIGFDNGFQVVEFTTE